MAMISESARTAQLRHHNRQDVVIYSAVLIHLLPNVSAISCSPFLDYLPATP
jgi:hypothetical protein